jgi:hypothetical protein
VKGRLEEGPQRPGRRLHGAARGAVRLAIIFVRARRSKKRLVRRIASIVADFIALLLFYLL